VHATIWFIEDKKQEGNFLLSVLKPIDLA